MIRNLGIIQAGGGEEDREYNIDKELQFAFISI